MVVLPETTLYTFAFSPSAILQVCPPPIILWFPDRFLDYIYNDHCAFIICGSYYRLHFNCYTIWRKRPGKTVWEKIPALQDVDTNDYPFYQEKLNQNPINHESALSKILSQIWQESNHHLFDLVYCQGIVFPFCRMEVAGWLKNNNYLIHLITFKT